MIKIKKNGNSYTIKLKGIHFEHTEFFSEFSVVSFLSSFFH